MVEAPPSQSATDDARRYRHRPPLAIHGEAVPPRAPVVMGAHQRHQWLDSWTGLGLIAVGLHRQGWDLQLTQYDDGNWRATFYVTGAAHSIVGGSAWEPTPWRAVQRAA
jgi:hypothetical protein